MAKRPYNDRLHYSNPIHTLARDKFLERREDRKRQAQARSGHITAEVINPLYVIEANGLAKWENDLLDKIVVHPR